MLLAFVSELFIIVIFIGCKTAGGFIILRFFNPALTTPEAFDLLHPGTAPSPVVRRNLILVTKIIQNLSNNVQFGQKEQFMADMNPFLKKNAQKMRRYLETLPKDPLAVSFHFLFRFLALFFLGSACLAI
jgi:hypothetical protein